MTKWVKVDADGVVDGVSYDRPMVQVWQPDPAYEEVGDAVFAGWKRNEDGEFEPPPPPPEPEPQAPAVPTISRRQFFQAAAVMNIISQEEALAALRTGELPPLLEGIVAGLPAEQQFALRMLLAGADALHIDHPAVPGIAAALGMDEAQTLQFWQLAATL